MCKHFCGRHVLTRCDELGVSRDRAPASTECAVLCRLRVQWLCSIVGLSVKSRVEFVKRMRRCFPDTWREYATLRLTVGWCMQDKLSSGQNFDRIFWVDSLLALDKTRFLAPLMSSGGTNFRPPTYDHTVWASDQIWHLVVVDGWFFGGRTHSSLRGGIPRIEILRSYPYVRPYDVDRPNLHGDTTWNEKSAQRRRKHCALAVVKRRAKNFRFAADPLPGARDGQNLISWRWSLPLPTNPDWWRSMHAISSYRNNRPARTHKPTHKQTGPITIHCATASAQCN